MLRTHLGVDEDQFPNLGLHRSRELQGSMEPVLTFPGDDGGTSLETEFVVSLYGGRLLPSGLDDGTRASNDHYFGGNEHWVGLWRPEQAPQVVLESNEPVSTSKIAQDPPEPVL